MWYLYFVSYVATGRGVTVWGNGPYVYDRRIQSIKDIRVAEVALREALTEPCDAVNILCYRFMRRIHPSEVQEEMARARGKV